MRKKGEKGEGREENQTLLDAGSDSELDVEILAPDSAPQNKSMTRSQRPEPTEYDRWVILSSSFYAFHPSPELPILIAQDAISKSAQKCECCAGVSLLCNPAAHRGPAGCCCQTLQCLCDVCR